MKVAVPVDDKLMESAVCPSFGRAPYFLIYDSDTQEGEFLDNKAAASQGGAGIKAAQTIVDHQIKALLTPRCGQNAAEVIKAAKVDIYRTVNKTAQENIDAYLAGELSMLEEIHPGMHNHRGR